MIRLDKMTFCGWRYYALSLKERAAKRKILVELWLKAGRLPHLRFWRTSFRLPQHR